NDLFVGDFLAFVSEPRDILDLGTGTAQIPIALCRACSGCRVLAVDAAASMLDVARYNVELAGLIDRIQLARADAKQLPYATGYFSAVISNSIAHHLAEPGLALREGWRVTAPGGSLFFRDLLRPATEAECSQLVEQYTGHESPRAQRLFADSLRAALSLEEIQSLVVDLDVDASSVRRTSDRHWTWAAIKEDGGR
ncbi:MAG TPA: class I SAM-dependent methyltransferase, partial [Pirellulaceae bacterium]